MKKNSALRRSQLDWFYKELKKINLTKPRKGWIKELRDSLGMSMEDLATRMGTIKQRILKIEKDELSSKLTLETMNKAAEAMNCELVYFIVPKASLEEIVDNQVNKVAEEVAKVVEKTMSLEQQKNTPAARKKGLELIKKKIISENYKKLWKTK